MLAYNDLHLLVLDTQAEVEDILASCEVILQACEDANCSDSGFADMVRAIVLIAKQLKEV